MTKLCPRGKAAAKRKFKVYPSAYANAYASKICAGKIKDPSGVKRKDFRGPKPSGARVGMAVTAGAQSATGRLEKSGIKKMMCGGFGIFSKKKKEGEKKSTQESNAEKKRKRLEEIRKGGAKKGKMMIMIAIGKPKKANEGVYIQAPKPPRRIKGKSPQNISTEYIKKKRAYDTLVGNNNRKRKRMSNPRLRPVPQMKTGGDAKIKKVIKGLHKASSLHKGQAKSLQTLVKKANKGAIMRVANKLEKASKAHAGQAKTLKSLNLSRGGGAAIRGTNFKGVF